MLRMFLDHNLFQRVTLKKSERKTNTQQKGITARKTYIFRRISDAFNENKLKIMPACFSIDIILCFFIRITTYLLMV